MHASRICLKKTKSVGRGAVRNKGKGKPSQRKVADKNPQSESASNSATKEPSLRMPLSLPHTRDFWDTVEAASATVKRMVTSSSLRKNYFALAATEKHAVSQILDTPATNGNGGKNLRYQGYTWLQMTLNRLSFMRDIQGNQLWKICKFQLGDFYKVAPQALENFHDVLGELQNEFPTVSQEEFDQESKRIGEGLQDEMAKHRGLHKRPTYAEREVPHRKIGEFLRNSWYEQALKNPSSLAGELSQMVGHFVFNTAFSMSRRVAFDLQQRNAQYQKGSCQVKRISVRSAMTFWVPPDGAKQKEAPMLNSKYLQAYNTDRFDVENYDYPSGVLVQIKLLYCLQRTIEPKNAKKTEMIHDDTDERTEVTHAEEETYHCEATFEGWLHGGPEGNLQWRIIEFLDINKNR